MATRTYQVEGMTCGHCELSVTEEVSQIEGVSSVSADHTTGVVEVEGEGLSDEAIADAIEEAGFSLA